MLREVRTHALIWAIQVLSTAAQNETNVTVPFTPTDGTIQTTTVTQSTSSLGDTDSSSIIDEILTEWPIFDGHNDLPYRFRKCLENTINDGRYNFKLNIPSTQPAWALNCVSSGGIDKLEEFGLVATGNGDTNGIVRKQIPRKGEFIEPEGVIELTFDE